METFLHKDTVRKANLTYIVSHSEPAKTIVVSKTLALDVRRDWKRGTNYPATLISEGQCR